MIIGYDNKYNLATLTASDENPAFPVENSQDTRLSRLYKSTSTSINIVVDLGESLTATAFFLANHNLTSSATITIEGNATDSWTTPSYSNSITYSADIIQELFATQTYRYWRVVISDATNTDTFIKFGNIFLGTYLSITNSSHNITVNDIDTTTETVSQSGQRYRDIGYIYKQYQLNFPRITQTEKEALITLKASNRKKPVYIMIDSTGVSEFTPIYGSIADISYSRVFNNFYTISMTINEAK